MSKSTSKPNWGKPAEGKTSRGTPTIVPGVDRLQHRNPEAYLIWIGQMEQVMLSTYPTLGGFVTSREFTNTAILKEDDIPADIKDLVGKPQTEAKAELQKHRTRAYAQEQLDKKAIYGKMMATLDSEGTQAVKSHADYLAAKTPQCPLLLLEVIEKTHVDEIMDYTRQTPVAAAEAMGALFEYRQKPGQTLLQYRDTLTLMIKRVKGTGGFEPINATQQAALFFRGVDRETYGQCIRDLENAMVYSTTAKMPETLDAAYQMLIKFRVRDMPTQRNRGITSSYAALDANGSTGAAGAPTADGGGAAHGSRRAAHDAKAAPKRAKTDECHKCGKKGHWARECRSERREPNQAGRGGGGRGRGGQGPGGRWGGGARTAVQAAQMDDAPASMDFSGNPMFLAGAHGEGGATPSLTATGGSLMHLFIYDSGASSHMVNSTQYVTEVRQLDTPTTFSGATGKGTVHTVGILPFFGVTGVHPEATANLISGTTTELKYPVHFEQLVEYKVCVEHGLVLHFAYNDRFGVYTSDLWPVISPYREMHVHASVGLNKANYNKSELDRADQAKDIMRKLAHCTPDDLIAMIGKGAVTNMPITTADVRRCVSIYGPSIECVKGTTAKKAAGGVGAVEEGPVDRAPLHLHADVFEIQQDPFLLVVAKPINLLIATDLGGRVDSRSLNLALTDTILLLRERNWRPARVYVDAAGSMAKIGRTCDGVQLLQSAAGSHVPVAERAIRHVKNHVRSVLAGLSYPLPRSMIPHLVRYVCNRNNCIPRSSGVGPSAREVFTGVKLDFKVDLKLGFGDFVQVFNNKVRSNDARESRTLDAIALGPMDNARGSWRFLHIETNRVITSDRWLQLPVSDGVAIKLAGMHKAEEEARAKARQPSVEEELPEQPEPAGDDTPQDGAAGTSTQDTAAGADADTSQSPQTDRPAVVEGDAAVDEDESPPECIIGAQLSLRAGLREWGSMAADALRAEVTQLHEKGTFEPVDPTKLDPSTRIIRSSFFFKEKRDSNGAVLKIKGRLVAGGNEQDVSGIENVSSPTVSMEALFCVLGIAAVEQRYFGSVDIEGAYLECDMEGPPVYMMLAPQLASALVEISQTVSHFVRKNGSVVVKLKKALYGCVQSAVLWYKKLSGVLTKAGFVANPVEECVFNRMTEGKQSTVAIYVDDLLVTHDDCRCLSGILTEIGSCFRGHKLQTGNCIGHLGMRMQRMDNGDIYVDMETFTKHAVEVWGVPKASRCPADGDLFEISDKDEPLDQQGRIDFHSAVARLLFLAKRVRPDICTAVSFLCSRTTAPTLSDWCKLDRLFGYLAHTMCFGIKFRADGKLEPMAYADAAFLVHEDAVSRTGVIVMVAGGVVYGSSSKQKLVTKSSAEAELVAMCDGATAALVVRAFMYQQGHQLQSSELLEDNKSAIDMVRAGKPTSRRTKHINMRYYFVKQHVDSGEFVIVYCPTGDMLADLMTKPVVGSLFLHLRGQIVCETPAV